ncbi:hypothetical protein JV173_04470 [Acholeplasma equirhinis]|uniref:DUF5696 domain-containing protein n=1 Tax=Acholeplasma equirhinis TaxID=555393 RepID=UPI00197AF95D|nr:DUF5696 domain-containing protein [Acholeplasma equirhinis]MBN3490765.1 hypothetical protein [Acholeplasma equirhinis]
MKTFFKKHYMKLIIGVLAVALFTFALIGIPFEKQSYAYLDTDVFTKEGFIDANDLSDKNKVVGENENFILYIDETTSYIRVVDKATGYTWYSNPTANDTRPLTTNAAKWRQSSTLEITFYNPRGSIGTMNNFRMSINHPESVLNAAGIRSYYIKYGVDSVQILYHLVDLEISHLYFPKMISKEQMESYDPVDQKELQDYAYTGFDADWDAYVIANYSSNMTNNVKRRLYKILYGNDQHPGYGYTLERAQEENAAYGVEEVVEKAEFEIAIEVKLLPEGISTKIIRDSIKETLGRINEITLYPLFGTAHMLKDGEASEGYLVVPDGSGAVIEFNNGKVQQNVYRKRVYGQDLAQMPYAMAEQQQKISIPLYGMVKDEGAFAAIITEGDAMATISADISNRVDSYNKIYTTFTIREVEAVTLGSGFNKYGINLLTEEIANTDFEVSYFFLSGANKSYVDIANVYRNYLINNLGLDSVDETTKAILTVELLGAYDKRDFFLGIPYQTLDSLTTFDQAKLIIEELMNRNVTNMNISYLGAANGGLTNQLFDRNDIPNVLGGRDGFVALNEYLKSNGIELYQNANFASSKGFRGAFDEFMYNAKRIRGAQAMYFGYHYPSRLAYDEFDASKELSQNLLNPLYYQAVYDAFNKQGVTDGLLLSLIGSSLVGSYERDLTLYKQDALRIQQDFLAGVSQDLMLSNPLGFAMPYASFISDLPTATTLYALIDYQIPLLQLILSGLVDYSPVSINLTSDRSPQYQFLKVLETGSNLKYTLSYDSSLELLNTDHNQYMSTHYVNWLDTIQSEMATLNSLKIAEGRLVGHRKVKNNVYEVTYSNGLILLINYNVFDETYNLYEIPAMSFFVVQEAQ